ncbi:MAG: ribbon-helix-helix domain-containing protein [Halopenitus sp.]
MAQPSISIPDELLDEVDEVAHDRSEPGDRTSRSEVVRDALEEYLERHCSEGDAPAGGVQPAD